MLTGLDERQARLLVDGQAYQVPLLQLAAAWRGEYGTLWRPPPGYATGRLQDAAIAAWVAERLAALQGGDAVAPTEGAAALRAGIAAFQRAQGLPADGVAGPVTLMQLARAAGVPEPRLARLQSPAAPASR